MDEKTNNFMRGNQRKNIRLSAALLYMHLAMEMDCLLWNQAPRPQTSLGSETGDIDVTNKHVITIFVY